MGKQKINDLNKQWFCEICGDLLGEIIDDNTTCQCDYYESEWSRIEDAQAEMD